jgi:hypothetical protein
MKRIQTVTNTTDEGITISVPSCDKPCVRIIKGAEFVEECDNYVIIGSSEYCNETCVE